MFSIMAEKAGRVPQGAEAYCAPCERMFATVGDFDWHRLRGRCVNPKTVGQSEIRGVWGRPESHAKRKADQARMAKAREQRGSK